jgi:hypothetical protein
MTAQDSPQAAPPAGGIKRLHAEGQLEINGIAAVVNPLQR